MRTAWIALLTVSVQQEQLLSSFAARVAAARSAHAAACMELHGERADCAPGRSHACVEHRRKPCPVACKVNVSEREKALLERRFPQNVSVACLQRGGRGPFAGDTEDDVLR